ncbi:uncharacterized protein FN964_009043 isoform 1-T1 [Alca torda]
MQSTPLLPRRAGGRSCNSCCGASRGLRYTTLEVLSLARPWLPFCHKEHLCSQQDFEVKLRIFTKPFSLIQNTVLQGIFNTLASTNVFFRDTRVLLRLIHCHSASLQLKSSIKMLNRNGPNTEP